MSTVLLAAAKSLHELLETSGLRLSASLLLLRVVVRRGVMRWTLRQGLGAVLELRLG